MHVLLSAEESEPFLTAELRSAWPEAHHQVIVPGLMSTDAALPSVLPPRFVFSRQLLPDASEETAASISAWSERLYSVISTAIPEDGPWSLHVEPHYGNGAAGRNRCCLVVESLRERLQRKSRRRLRSLRTEFKPFDESDSLVQLILTEPERGFLSVAAAPVPFQFRSAISPFPKGDIPVASDKKAPSRAFAKLLEAELRLGRRVEQGEVCVDLGACPGSWSYVALHRGAQVTAVDRSPLRADLMRHSGLTFHQGDAFKFRPESPVDWLLCDVIAAPERSIELLLDWVRRKLARHFIVTIKFKGHEDYGELERLKQALPPFCEDVWITRLCANKNEACAFGRVKP
ncbi:MAG TPA: SAM-dependent methyltransferase [Verrucomicrobiae bacterium]|nr:SAM-dependent methyltransferase [Verrucomicrobiae bacterium]